MMTPGTTHFLLTLYHDPSATIICLSPHTFLRSEPRSLSITLSLHTMPDHPHSRTNTSSSYLPTASSSRVTTGITHPGDHNEGHTKDRTDSPVIDTTAIDVCHQRLPRLSSSNVDDCPDRRALDMRAPWPKNPRVILNLYLVHCDGFEPTSSAAKSAAKDASPVWD
jgi:hypothetical protein